MSTIDFDLVELFLEELKLCKVRAGETVAVLTAGDEWAHYAQALMKAASRLGARTFNANVQRNQDLRAAVQGRHPFSDQPLLLETLKQCDMVIDLVGLLFSREQLDMQKAGVRILRIMEPVNVLRAMFPTRELAQRVERGRSLLMGARHMHITSRHGTDIHYELGQYPVMSEYGYTDEPGRWDNFPSGFVFTQANDGAVNGRVVLRHGDILAAFKRYLQSEVVLTIENGYVTKIEGQGMDADLIRTYMDSFHDPRAYAVSHIGWGLNDAARWYQFESTRNLHNEHVMNALSFYGNVLFSLGPNVELGGDNDTACHLDIPLRGCSLTLDGVEIVRDGDVVHPDMRVERAVNPPALS
ncbi:MAG: 2,5-dihydroxypyridine 5,6-dioxygenase [Pigmentiphaga sp.]|uniref:2,5-dihydroxypyridine 5,6-dioxygenase n=1 Tax=Pigmentiphaga sp. TaxID=1977564 RepID=UPI0029BF9122|nr:2,5-dihydroxypyridine 5,6-dioxygenase [Pigmentiphaga sp.]MDX3905148.1 2,5-dihydroxypyridine 5,6-dioxygenase [Pigmentiphaga sp.]